MDRPDRARTLVALLGPSGPQVGCDECFALLDRYAELRLAGADADAALPGMRPHLVGCPACREDHESLRALVSLSDGACGGWWPCDMTTT